ncbi:tripartite tricarboxylate transporter TctB family protein [Paraburkholderia sp. Ac-20336]|uniref:tripartite tricarboxylate transporter TctB family protein n=1 Tax=Paraburkholderia sp. Ac-20336 TaxID=2703886 RepID=UPI00197F6CAC|nr:tripartite tricarboxylate transporter TctB family protein [Paraburkholderia sp. Ac-20336]
MQSTSRIGRLFNRRNQDYYAGTLMMIVGLSAAYTGRSYGVGSFSRMGAGFFPVALGGLLVLVGIGIAMSRKHTDTAVESQISTEMPRKSDVSLGLRMRGWLCIIASIIAFVVLGRYGGLLPASFAVGLIAALGDPDNRLRDALLLALALCVVATVVFWWALRMQFPLFTWG